MKRSGSARYVTPVQMKDAGVDLLQSPDSTFTSLTPSEVAFAAHRTTDTFRKLWPTKSAYDRDLAAHILARYNDPSYDVMAKKAVKRAEPRTDARRVWAEAYLGYLNGSRWLMPRMAIHRDVETIPDAPELLEAYYTRQETEAGKALWNHFGIDLSSEQTRAVLRTAEDHALDIKRYEIEEAVAILAVAGALEGRPS